MTAGPRPCPRQRARDTLRGLAALAVLVVLLVGLPAVLYTVAGAPIPHRLPSPGQLTDTLGRRDNGQLFLACLLLLAWAGWAAFTAAVAVETLAQLRGRGAPRLPALGGPQRLAGQLVTAVVVAFLGAGPLLAHPAPASPSAARPVTAPVAAISVQIPAAARPHPDAPSTSGHNTPHDASAAGRAASPAKIYTVARGDTLWGIAETHLGDPERYVEIARFNYGRPQPDGRALTSAHWVYPGWTLVLPPDATGLPSRAHAPTGHTNRVAGGQQEPSGTGVPQPEQGGQQPHVAGSRPPERGPASPTPTAARSLARPEPMPSARSHPVPQVTVPPTGQPTGEARPSDGFGGPEWMEAPLIAGSVAGGLIAALTVLRLRRRRDYQPSQPAPSRTGPRPAPRLQRLAASTHDDDDVDSAGNTINAERAEDPDAYPRRLSQVEIGQRDGTPVTLDLLAWPGLALTGAGAAPVLRSLLADLLARARRYELQALCDQPAAARLLGDAPPARDAVHLTDSIGASLLELEIACVSRSRRFAEAIVDDYDGYRQACPDDPLPLLVLVTTAPPTAAAEQLTSLLTVGRRLGITALILGRPPAEIATLDISADGQLTAADPNSLHNKVQGVRLAALSAGDAATVLTTLAAAAPGGLPAAITRPAPRRDATGIAPEPLAASEDRAASTEPAAAAVRCDARLDSQPATGPHPQITVQLLGPARVSAWGQEISAGLRGSARELLAYFLLQPDGATAEAAIDALWPQVDTERGRQRFWTALGNLRSRLRGPTGSPEVPVIAKHGEHYRADGDLLQVDLWQFQAALGEAQHAAGDPVAEAAALQRAAEIYRGEFADGVDYLWAEAAREDLHRRALDALVRLADLHTDQEPQQAIADLDRAIVLDPYAEEIYRRLIRLHIAAGRPEAARRTYQQLRDRLADLDLEPDAATEMLIAGGLRVDRHEQRRAPRPAAAPAGPRR